MPNDQQQQQDGEAQTGRPEIVQTERNVPFLGLTGYNDPEVPAVYGHHSSKKWWTQDRWPDEDGEGADVPDDVRGFSTVIRDLPRAQLAEAAWVHPTTGEVIKTGKHNAVINPEVAENIDKVSDTEAGFDFGEEYVETVEEAREHWGDQWREHIVGDDALYQIPTDDYTVVNPMEFLEPLAREARDRELGDAMFGEFRLFRSGGKVSADVFLDGQHVDVPDRDDGDGPIVTGFQIDYDHFGGTSISAQGMALNTACMNAMRAFTDPVSIKHTGDMDERTFEVGDTVAHTWREVWSKLFDLIDEKRDQLSEIIEAAAEMQLSDVMDLPEDFGERYRNNDDVRHPRLFAFYKFMGYPDYLAKEAARDAFANAQDTSDPTWWDLHNGATYAVTHFSRADAAGGSQVEQQMRLANDVLFNPPNVADDVQEAYLKAQDEDGLASEGGGEATLVRTEEKSEMRERFEERQQQMEALVEAEQ